MGKREGTTEVFGLSWRIEGQSIPTGKTGFLSPTQAAAFSQQTPNAVKARASYPPPQVGKD
jgi:hypothetical protein